MLGEGVGRKLSPGGGGRFDQPRQPLIGRVGQQFRVGYQKTVGLDPVRCLDVGAQRRRQRIGQQVGRRARCL